MQMEVQAGPYVVTIQGDSTPFQLSVATDNAEEGIAYIHLTLSADGPWQPPELSLIWSHPLIETHQQWHPGVRYDRTIKPDWFNPHVTSKGTSNAPVYALHNLEGRNALTFAVSDALNVVQCGAAISEEEALARCRVILFPRPGSGPPLPFFMGAAPEPAPRLAQYTVSIRLDTRPIPYYTSLGDVSRWWSEMVDYHPSPVPEHARLPLYSTWYSFHQRLDSAAIEEQCRLAKEMGMEVIIVDDGWQTDNNERGYAYCGDWEVTPTKFPDFAGHVRRVQEIGLRYVLWFSVPFVGIHTKAHQRFAGKYLDPATPRPWNVLDPRFPEVRSYLIGIYKRFATEYGIDGFKLDFVDAFRLTPETERSRGEGRDYESIPEAVNRLLTDVLKELRATNPDALIEFRQTYVGPLMRKYGNMLRAGDVPANLIGNRVNTLDVRLLAGNTPAHADMVMWHPNDTVESAAMQIIHTIFAVPQISVDLTRIPSAHREMIRFYMRFWREHRDLLMDGELAPLGPAELYPAVISRTPEKLLAAYFATSMVQVAGWVPPTVILVNGTMKDSIVLRLEEPAGMRSLTVASCTGITTQRAEVDLSVGLHEISVPPAGVAVLALQP